jgi:hypothetical protein
VFLRLLNETVAAASGRNGNACGDDAFKVQHAAGFERVDRLQPYVEPAGGANVQLKRLKDVVGRYDQAGRNRAVNAGNAPESGRRKFGFVNVVHIYAAALRQQTHLNGARRFAGYANRQVFKAFD